MRQIGKGTWTEQPVSSQDATDITVVAYLALEVMSSAEPLLSQNANRNPSWLDFGIRIEWVIGSWSHSFGMFWATIHPEGFQPSLIPSKRDVQVATQMGHFIGHTENTEVMTQKNMFWKLYNIVT